jgi:hypothetical protein
LIALSLLIHLVEIHHVSVIDVVLLLLVLVEVVVWRLLLLLLLIQAREHVEIVH